MIKWRLHDTAYNYTMIVTAMPENNNTRITWLMVFPLDYRSGRLTVMGKFIIKHHSVIVL